MPLMRLTTSLILRKPRSCCLEERSAPIPLFLLVSPEIISERDMVPRGFPRLARVRRMREQRGLRCSAAVFRCSCGTSGRQAPRHREWFQRYGVVISACIHGIAKMGYYQLANAFIS